jgi:hypothetical protein
MQSAFLNQMGLGSFDLGYMLIGMIILAVLFLIVFILLIVQIVKVSKLRKRLDQFLLGNDGKSLEQKLIEVFDNNKQLLETTEQHSRNIRSLYKKLESTYQKMGLVKYDAFNQMGGQLSFCLALLDENNNGFLMNSVHGAESCYTYMKEIKNGENNLSLSPEETEALAMAMRG